MSIASNEIDVDTRVGSREKGGNVRLIRSIGAAAVLATAALLNTSEPTSFPESVFRWFERKGWKKKATKPSEGKRRRKKGKRTVRDSSHHEISCAEGEE